MDITAIIYKIKQTGRSTAKERKLLREEILNTIEYSEEFIEEQSYALFIKYKNAHIGALYEKDNYALVTPFGNFKLLFEEQPDFSQSLAEKLTGVYQQELNNLPQPSEKLEKLSASQKQNGYGFEFGLILGLKSVLTQHQKAFTIEQDTAYSNLAENFATLSSEQQDDFINAGTAAASQILDKENIFQESNLVIKAQHDREGIKGDVRDIIISTSTKEIGFSCKNNNEAAKHSRISPSIDFVRSWLKLESGASIQFKDELNTIFDTMTPYVGKLWAEVDPESSMKARTYYEPILKTFKTELEEQIKNNPQVVPALFKYIIGEQDYYKVVKKDAKKMVEIHGYNLDGTLDSSVPRLTLPSKITNSYFKVNRQGLNNKLVLEFDQGWSICLRIHNASKEVEKSFKFDIGLESAPEIFKESLNF